MELASHKILEGPELTSLKDLITVLSKVIRISLEWNFSSNFDELTNIFNFCSI